MMFKDVYKVFYEWTSHSHTPTLTFDPDTGELTTGFPALPSWRDWPHSAWAQGADGHFPTGVYDMVYDGDADLVPGKSFKKVGRNHYQFTALADRKTQLVMNGFPLVNLSRNNPNNLFRNAHFYLPGHLGDKETWLSEFVDRVKRFNGPYRDKDLTLTDSNSASVKDWSQRTLPTQVRWVNSRAGRPALTGAPYEAMIELHNMAENDAWINIPFSATDDYILKMAQLYKSSLNPKLKIYIEYGNEIWNFRYQAGQMQGKLYPPGNKDNFYGQSSWYSYRSEQVFRIFESVFGESSPQLVRVIAGQSVWSDRQAFLMKEAKLFAGGHKAADVLAVAPYFPEKFAEKVVDAQGRVTISMDQLFAALRENINTTIRAHIRNNLAVARKYNAELVGYEGGQGLVGRGPAENSFYIAASRDPRMYDIYMQYLGTLEAEGVSLIVLFNDIELPSRFGIYGHAESSADANDATLAKAPKLRATLDFINGKRVALPPPTLPRARPPAAARKSPGGKPLSLAITANPSTGSAPLKVTFTVKAANPNADSKIVSYHWWLGGKWTAPSASPTLTHTFTNAGTYAVGSRATDDKGRFVEGRLKITVK
jgi:hypothetical protein